ncbi:MAG TPA: Rieske 2Fe-2S domain-containing protein [Chloroflexota bacterium]|nr:Rieske 2Fe-2S domain-containing protein [Chloroflexota bacterium]
MADHQREPHEAADDAVERVLPSAERLNAAIDDLLAERRPTTAAAGADEAELFGVAALLKQLRPETAEPRLEYADELGRRLRAARDGRPGRPRAVSRRGALAAGAAALAAAAGAAGFALGRFAEPGAPSPGGTAQRADPSRDLTLVNGEWFPVATLADVPPGTVQAFTAGAIMGHLINDSGNLRALSAICTHMGCIVDWNAATRQFDCPCHGANFDLEGVIQPTPQYPYRPPPLIRIPVKVEDDQVFVLSASPASWTEGRRPRRAPAAPETT